MKLVGLYSIQFMSKEILITCSKNNIKLVLSIVNISKKTHGNFSFLGSQS